MYQLCCKDVGFDCPGVVRGETVDSVLEQAAGHAARDHGVTITPEMAGKVAALVTQVPDAPPTGAAR